ncbi:fibronectin type III domain-containing protein [Lentzea sp. BCCO 10_0856]|uniref:Fibronectin type III domain-containing protein n=1 Tax=Lentzea miocenica TaxID=3095431 RepID=A0ABU4SRU4_9PSEU|nr:fibronectin type III domain-containing protein [Lentzea sp. BCCO 10_0856]MDX8028611.1 fibronectin type III domain-containing protein [Lentzea sp. BCCO 10_0856]
MQLRRIIAAACGPVLAIGVLAAIQGSPAAAGQPDTPGAPPAAVNGVAKALGISPQQARTQLNAQDEAHKRFKSLPPSLLGQLAGHWFDAEAGVLTVAVTSDEAAAQAQARGVRATRVQRSKADLDRQLDEVRTLVGNGVPGVFSWGVDVKNNQVSVTVNTTRTTQATERFVAAVRKLGVKAVETDSQQRQQAGTVQTGSPWWPGSESNCSVGFGATDTNGGKHFLTAGHCTNDAGQAAYGQSGQQNRIGTSNVGGSRSVNAREGDMGVVAVTEAGWNLSAAVNTWGEPAITVTGSAEAMVGDRVCHSGNTSKWKCGEVKYTNKAVDYGGGLVIEDLTWTTACSLGGDSGGGWLLGDKAVGLHDGGPSQCVQNPADDDMSIFQPVNEALRKWNLTLVTGGSNDTTAPSAPGNPRSTGTTSSSVSLQWDASTDNVGVTGYDVYNGSALATTVTTTNATVTGLKPDNGYTFTIKAKDAAGNASAASAAVNARTQPGTADGEPPTTPGNPRSTGVTASSVSLAWDASVDNVGVASYEVFNGSALATTVTTTSATVTGLTADTAYSFTVQATDAAGNRSKPSPAVSARTSPGDTGGRTFTNDTDYPIRDFQVAVSAVRSTATGTANNPITVKVGATHTCLEDLNVTLAAPSGRWYPLLRTPGGSYSCTPFPAGRTFTVVPVAGEAAGGTWTLRIGDNGPGDVGVLSSWSVTL